MSSEQDNFNNLFVKLLSINKQSLTQKLTVHWNVTNRPETGTRLLLYGQWKSEPTNLST